VLLHRMKSALTKELEYYSEGSCTYRPLDGFSDTTFLTLINFKPPRELLYDIELFNSLRIISNTFKEINITIRNRESFKLNSISNNSEFRFKVLSTFDLTLMDRINTLLELYDKYYDEIIIKEKDLHREIRNLY
jgi:hypothetical protein